MPIENKAEIFIRTLVEEFDAYQTVRKFDLSRQIKAQASRFRQFRKADPEMNAVSTEPLDCLQMMSTAPQRRIGQ